MFRKKNQPVHEVIINVHILKAHREPHFGGYAEERRHSGRKKVQFQSNEKKCTTGAKATMVLAWMEKHASEPLLLANTGKSSKLLRR